MDGITTVRALSLAASRVGNSLVVVRHGQARPSVLMAAAVFLALTAIPEVVRSQAVTGRPVSLAGGRLTVSGEAAASVATEDSGYFDYSAYDYNLMRLVRIDAAAALRLTEHLSFLGDVRLTGSTAGGGWRVRPFAAFARLRPWTGRAVVVQAGLIPPVFGAFTRRGYGADNPLIGLPLTYQYLTSLRSDAVPASVSDLLDMRGRGWRTGYPVGEQALERGLPIVDGLRFPSGVQLRLGNGRPIEVAGAWTSGSLSTPAIDGGKAGRQLSGRVAVQPIVGFVFGVSGSRGTFLDEALRSQFADTGVQQAIGLDAEFSRDHWLVRAEGVLTTWRLPRLEPSGIGAPLRAVGIDVEGRYRLRPGLYAAARLGGVDFSEINGAPPGSDYLYAVPWDAPVGRIEVGAGYSLLRNALLKVAWQRNWRNLEPYAPASNLVSAQVLAWF